MYKGRSVIVLVDYFIVVRIIVFTQAYKCARVCMCVRVCVIVCVRVCVYVYARVCVCT